MGLHRAVRYRIDLASVLQASPRLIGKTDSPDGVLSGVNIVLDSPEIDGVFSCVEDRVSRIGITIAWLADTPGIDDKCSATLLSILNVRMTEHETVIVIYLRCQGRK